MTMGHVIDRRTLNKRLSHNPRLHLFRPAAASRTTCASIREEHNRTIHGEARDLKEVVAEQTLELRLLKKSMLGDGDDLE